MTERYFEFTFFDGQVFRGWGRTAQDALNRMGLGAYNKAAYTVRDITDE